MHPNDQEPRREKGGLSGSKDFAPNFSPPPLEKNGDHKLDRPVVLPRFFFLTIEKESIMVQLRTNRNQTSFYRPTETYENSAPSRRGKIFNPKMRRWIQDTPRNRARLQKLIVKPKIRNPRTGRLILATPRNIRATEAYRLERVQQMLQKRAARLIVSKINQFRTLNQFTFNETSENFQTAEIRGSRLDTRAFNAFIAKIPQRYDSFRATGREALFGPPSQ